MAKKRFEFDFGKCDFKEGNANPYDEYKFVVEMTDKLNERRQKLHSIFETMLTALLALSYFIFRNESLEAWPRKPALVIIALLGIVISLVWDGIIKSYKELIDFRFQMLMRMEDKLKKFDHDLSRRVGIFSPKAEFRETVYIFSPGKNPALCICDYFSPPGDLGIIRELA